MTARGFTLLEILIVLILLLAMAALVVPAASAWLGNVQGDQVRDQVTQLIKDQLIESMRSRRPRAVWIASKPLGGPSRGSDAQSHAMLDESGASDSRAWDSRMPSPPAPTVRWVLGARPLATMSDRNGSSDAAGDDRTVSQATVELPRGWLLSAWMASQTDEDAQVAAEDGASEEAAGATDVPGRSGAGTDGALDAGEPAQAMILWPSGQIDVLIPLELSEPDGRRWRLEINPWTLAVAWKVSFTPSSDAVGQSGVSRQDVEAESRTIEPSVPQERDAPDAKADPDSSNQASSQRKDAKERTATDGTKPAETNDDQERPDAAMPR